MARSMFRVIFALAVSLSLALGVFAGVGTIPASAASGPSFASTPPGINYCYPTGYNRQGWRCGWRLAQAPYNLGDYNRYYYGYNYYPNYYYGYYGPYYNSGTGGYPPQQNPVVDYGGRPRYGYYYGGYYYQCSYWYNGYCYNY